MQLQHTFTVPVGIGQAWHVLLDVEQVAPCMPGAVLETVDGDDFSGLVKIKLGPIALTYKGKASFVEKDEAAHRATISAQGRDARGSSTAGATVTATLTADGETSTRVDVVTDLTITGKPAQFGRGVMDDVGNKLIGQFAACLADKLAAAQPTAEVPVPTPPVIEAAATSSSDGPESQRSSAPISEPTATDTPKLVSSENVQPIDLMASAGPAIAKRVAPVAAVVLVILIALLIRRRRTSS